MSHDACVIGQPVRVSSLQHDVVPKNLTWVIKLDGKYLYLLSRLGGSISNLYLEVLLFFMISVSYIRTKKFRLTLKVVKVLWFLYRVSFTLGWPQTHCVETSQVFLPLPPSQCWDYRHRPPHSAGYPLMLEL